MGQQALGQQDGQDRQHPAAGHRGGWRGETGLTLAPASQTGLHPPPGVMRRLALRGLHVPPVAPLTAQGLGPDRPCVRLGRCGLGLDTPCGLQVLVHGRQQALEPAGAQRGVAEIEFAYSPAQAGAVGQHASGPLQDLGILDAVAAVPLVDRGEAGLALALEALTGTDDGTGADVEGARQIGQGGELVQSAVCEAAVAGAEVVDAMGDEREGEGEADDSVPVEEEAEMAVDGDGVARLEIDGLGKSGGAGGRNSAFHSGVPDWPATSSQANFDRSKNAQVIYNQ